MRGGLGRGRAVRLHRVILGAGRRSGERCPVDSRAAPHAAHVFEHHGSRPVHGDHAGLHGSERDARRCADGAAAPDRRRCLHPIRIVGAGFAKFRVVYDVTATAAGATHYVNPIRAGSIATDERVNDRATGKPLVFDVVGAAVARAGGTRVSDSSHDPFNGKSLTAMSGRWKTDYAENRRTQRRRGLVPRARRRIGGHGW